MTLDNLSHRKSCSVVIPAYNEVSTIDTVLDALFSQTYPYNAYEIIVADNGSTDGSREVVTEFQRQRPDQLKLVIEDEVQSSYAARNRGIDIAKGDVIAFTDADCIPAADWIAAGVETLERSKASFAAGRIQMTYKEETPNVWEYLDAARKLNQARYVQEGFGATANLFVRRELFEEYGSFLAELRSGGDYEFGRRLTQAGESLVYAEDAVVYHPARTSFRDILKKTERIAQGQQQLSSRGLLQHNRLSLRDVLPSKSLPQFDAPLTRNQKIVVLIAVNFLNYYNLGYRLAWRWRST